MCKINSLPPKIRAIRRPLLLSFLSYIGLISTAQFHRNYIFQSFIIGSIFLYTRAHRFSLSLSLYLSLSFSLSFSLIVHNEQGEISPIFEIPFGTNSKFSVYFLPLELRSVLKNGPFASGFDIKGGN